MLASRLAGRGLGPVFRAFSPEIDPGCTQCHMQFFSPVAPNAICNSSPPFLFLFSFPGSSCVVAGSKGKCAGGTDGGGEGAAGGRAPVKRARVRTPIEPTAPYSPLQSLTVPYSPLQSRTVPGGVRNYGFLMFFYSFPMFSYSFPMFSYSFPMFSYSFVYKKNRPLRGAEKYASRL